MLRYRTDGVYPTSKTDGVLATGRPGVAGAKDYFDHVSLNNGTTYHYSAFTYDTALNHSSTAHTQATTVSLSISSISPNRGSVGTIVVIQGNGFGAIQGTSKVAFTGLVAQVSSWCQPHRSLRPCRQTLRVVTSSLLSMARRRTE